MKRLVLAVPLVAAGLALAACSSGAIDPTGHTDAPITSSIGKPCLNDSSAAAGSPACKAANGQGQSDPGPCPWDSTAQYGTDACDQAAQKQFPSGGLAPETTTPSEPAAPTTTEASAPTTTEASAPTTPSESPQLSNAKSAAQNYLSFAPFSKKGLIQQLSSQYGDQYPTDVATKAVDSLDVNWNEQAVKAGKNYLSFQPFSKSGLIQQLESPYGDNFTHSQAVYGATQALGG